jgi:SAM-dependent methyltransferase
MQQEHLDANKAMWDERVPIHVDSEMYANQAFIDGELSVKTDEIEEMGPVVGKTLLHLQCHFGQDTLSWARLGARVTGLDFSPAAVEAARKLAAQIGAEGARFVESDVYNAPAALGHERFDIVYTGAGAINWLADIDRWAAVVRECMAPGGTFYMREFHPVRSAFDDDPEVTELRPRWTYFHEDALVWDEPGTYADATAKTVNNVSYEWNHGIGEVITALVRAGLELEFVHEFPYISYKCFPFLIQRADGMYEFPGELNGVIPMMYTVGAHAPG